MCLCITWPKRTITHTSPCQDLTCKLIRPYLRRNGRARRMHALTLMLALSATFPSAASTISIAGADGPFASLPVVVTPIAGADDPLAPAADYALPYRAAGIFDLSAIDPWHRHHAPLRFADAAREAAFAGQHHACRRIDTTGIDLALETQRQGLITGSVPVDTFSLMAPLTGAITCVQ